MTYLTVKLRSPNRRFRDSLSSYHTVHCFFKTRIVRLFAAPLTLAQLSPVQLTATRNGVRGPPIFVLMFQEKHPIPRVCDQNARDAAPPIYTATLGISECGRPDTNMMYESQHLTLVIYDTKAVGTLE